jgi:hypothetical protein
VYSEIRAVIDGYGRSGVYAVSKRQLGAREIRDYGLDE